jgi:hypothetical protein
MVGVKRRTVMKKRVNIVSWGNMIVIENGKYQFAYGAA